ncbi:MAG: hypothetical protein LBV63_03960 [Candidatus Methanoplasma sp.]|jgi:hypothetical protein|nr:hypothetical protein [Candidatus Methanoplasma sp.]
MFEKRVIGRTYLLFGDDDNIQGYFTVGIKSMVIPDEMSDEISNSFRRRMNLANGDDMLATHLIGQLSRSNNSPKGTGDILMEQAMKIIDRCSALEGCRVVRVDCVDGLCGYYRGRGFKLLCKDRDEDLNQMIKILS